MRKLERRITCRQCDMTEVTEETTPLALQLDDAVMMCFGMPYYHCEGCDSIYMAASDENVRRLMKKMSRMAAAGVNTFIWTKH